MAANYEYRVCREPVYDRWSEHEVGEKWWAMAEQLFVTDPYTLEWEAAWKADPLLLSPNFDNRSQAIVWAEQHGAVTSVDDPR